MALPPHEFETFRFFTRRNALLFLGSFFLAVGIGGGGWPVASAGAFLYVLLIQQYFLDRPVLDQIKIRRRHSDRAFESHRLHLSLALEHPGVPGVSPACMITIRDQVAASTPSEILCQTALLYPGQRATFRTSPLVTKKRGLTIVGPIRIQTRDLFGVYSFRRTVDQLTRLTVVPRPFPAHYVPVLYRGTTPDVGRAILPHPARSQEFRTLRPYQVGDQPRLIHWPSSARHGRMMVKEFHGAVETDVWILTDFFLTGITGLGDKSSGEIRLAITASLVQKALAEGHRTKVLVAKGEPDESTLGTGRRHLEATLDWLGILKADGHEPFEPYLARTIPRMRRGATLFCVLSTLHLRPGKFFATLRLCRGRGVTPYLIFVEDRDLQKLRAEQDDSWYTNPLAPELFAAAVRGGYPAAVLSPAADLPSQLAQLGLSVVHKGR